MNQRTPTFFVAALLLACAGAAHADASATTGIYGQLGYSGSESKTSSYTIGVTKPMDWKSPLWGTQLSAYWDLYGTYLRSDSVRGNPTYDTWLIGLKPVLRMRFDEGRSPWFAEAGIGASVSSDKYRSGAKSFSTRFQFGDHVALGYTFGAQREHEVSLRFEHYSNANIKKPNPGENYVQVRYAHAF